MSSNSIYGYAGRFLRVDLTRGEITGDNYDEATLRKYLGGSCIGAKILYEEVPPGVEWSDPENRLIMATGPLGGTTFGGTGGFSVVTKCPMTNGAASTQANGFLGAYMKLSGFDGMVFHGSSPEWVYLHIHDNTAELKDARHLVGKDTWETEDAIRQELGKTDRNISICSIGPAGENLVKFACILADKGHAAGHGGVGAVMGSKKLKAVAVDRGKGGFQVKDRPTITRISRGIVEEIKASPHYALIYYKGTVGGVAILAESGRLPIKNYTTNIWDIRGDQLEKYKADYIRDKFKAKPAPCWACNFKHCHTLEITEGEYAGDVVEEPEYECMAAWGPVIGQNDAPSAIRLSSDVDRLGIDTNEGGWVVGWVMECFQRGLLTKEDIDGLEFNWGNVKSTRALLSNIAYRRGFGDVAAEGVMRAAAHIGGEAVNCAIHTMKGSTPRGHDHRAIWEEMFDTCVSNVSTMEANRNSARQQFGLPPAPDAFSPEYPKSVVNLVSGAKGGRLLEDSLVVCSFNTMGGDVARLSEAVSAATGWDFTFDEALDVGKRAVNLFRAFNLRHGITAEKDAPSPRYGSVPVDGKYKGLSIAPVWDEMLRSYYEKMGWDTKTGKPLPETLKALGLDNVIADL